MGIGRLTEFRAYRGKKKLRLKASAWKTPAAGGLSFAEKIRARKYTPYAGCGNNDIEAEAE